jgi:hypothetical protein
VHEHMAADRDADADGPDDAFDNDSGSNDQGQ